MEKPLISVIIPVYNAGKYLEQCMDSILNQTYKNLEVILVDDGSKDDSYEKCKLYAEKDNRVFAYHKSNGGVSSARNYGLERARGDYITFLDPDDYIDASMYDKLYAAIRKNGTEVAMCSYNVIRNNEVAGRGFSYGKEIISASDFLKTVFEYKDKGVVWNKLFAGECCINARFNENADTWEDIMFLVDVLKDPIKISIVDEPLHMYIQYPISATHGAFGDKQVSAFNVMDDMYEALVGTDLIYPYSYFAVTVMLFVYTNVHVSDNISDKRRKKRMMRKKLKKFFFKKTVNLKTKLRILFAVIFPRVYRYFRKKNKAKRESLNG